MVIGHQKILDYLKKSVAKERVSQGYLFYGPEKIGKKKVAIEFAKILQCQESDSPCGICKNCQDIENGVHPDFVIVQRSSDSQEIEISQIRNLRKILSLSSYSGNYKIAIIDEAENLNIEAANALLKTLEEPKGKTVLILISAFPHLLPKTVSSRLQQIKFSFVPTEILEEYLDRTGLEDSQKKEILKISAGKPGILCDMLSDLQKKDDYKSFMRSFVALKNFDYNGRFEYVKKIADERKSSIKFLNGMAIFFRDIFLIKCNCRDFIVNIFLEKEMVKISEQYQKDNLQRILKSIKQLNRMISLSNVNPRLGLEALMLEI